MYANYNLTFNTGYVYGLHHEKYVLIIVVIFLHKKNTVYINSRVLLVLTKWHAQNGYIIDRSY